MQFVMILVLIAEVVLGFMLDEEPFAWTTCIGLVQLLYKYLAPIMRLPNILGRGGNGVANDGEEGGGSVILCIEPGTDVPVSRAGKPLDFRWSHV